MHATGFERGEELARLFARLRLLEEGDNESV